MKITFIIPSTGICGGIKAVFEFANYLKKFGHDVCIIYPLIPLFSEQKNHSFKSWIRVVRGTIGNFIRGKSKVNWFDLKANLKMVPIIADKFIPDADVVVATWWATAYNVKKLSEVKGQKFYLVQHYETWGGPEQEVNDSYKLGLKIIVNSTWLKNLLQDKLKVKSSALIFHAPDHEQFYCEKTEKKERNVIRILMPYRSEKWKGATEGLLALKIVKKKYPNVKIVIFGPKPKDYQILKDVEFYNFPIRDNLRKIYNSCDIFVYPSLFEGFGMPPMEAMACKIPVVATRVGAVPDYSIPGKTALVSEPGDIKGLVENIIKLIEKENEREQIAENGYNYIKQFTWEKAAKQMEKLFLQNLRND